jgi:NTE family protein
LFPQFSRTETDDILLVQINPIERRKPPCTAAEIENRLIEVTFNANLLGELRAIAFVRRLIDAGKLSRQDYKRIRMHRIAGGEKLDAFAAFSRLNNQVVVPAGAEDLGRTAAQEWRAANCASVGVHSNLDLKGIFA